MTEGLSMNTTSNLVPLNVAARWLRVPLRWLRAEAEAGRVPCLRADDQILCDYEAIEAVLLKRARQIGEPKSEEK
jgi:hypothetical protein